MIETSANPLNMKNTFLKNKSIKNMKPKAQIRNHRNPIHYKNKWGTILHKEKAYTTKGYQ
jgi:hypothetical protein